MKTYNKNVTSDNPLIVLIDRPSKKGNFGTIIRSCDALGVDKIFYTGHSVDIYDHNVITSSMGSFFKVPFRFLESNSEYENLILALKNQYKNFQVVATSLQAEKSIYQIDFTFPTLLLVGNEATGLSKFYNTTADIFAKIDMRPDIDSLNVACATSIFLYEVSRQRREKC